MRTLSWFGCVCLLVAVANAASPAAAQEVSIRYEPPLEEPEARDPDATWSDIRDARSFGLFAAGAFSGFLLHEAGHVFANLVQGNVPKFQGIWGFGFIPFFTIAPRVYCPNDQNPCYKHDGSSFPTGVRGKFAITYAGFNVQHLTDEVLLTRNPELRYHQAPFRKGLLAFNILLSVGYALAAVTRIENPQGDLTRSAQLIGMPREVYAAMLLIPAALDTYRYFVPGSRWAPWVSRTSKLAVFGLVFTLR